MSSRADRLTRDRLWPAGQDHRTHDYPVELAPADDASVSDPFFRLVRSWYSLLYDHRTCPARCKCTTRHRAHHHCVTAAELATRLSVDCQLEGTGCRTAHRRCRKD